MSPTMIIALIAGLLAALAWWLARDRTRWGTADRAWLPAQLNRATLAYSEEQFFTEHPRPMVVRIDRAYRQPDGMIELVEFKGRMNPRAHLSDVVELSAQAMVMRANGHDVASRGWVVAVDPRTGRHTPIAVELEPERAVAARQERLLALQAGRVKPAGARNPVVCRSCNHRARCDKRLA